MEKSIKLRITFLTLACFAIAAGILTKAISIQIIGDRRVERLAQRQFNSRVLVTPRRGQILDRNGEPLAINTETKSLVANPSKIRDKVRVSLALSKLLGDPARNILKKLENAKEFVWIKRQMSEGMEQRYNRWRLVEAEEEWVNSLWLVKESRRVYPHGTTAAHVLGSVNLDSRGIEGVELWHDDRLGGKVTSIRAAKDALGRPIFLDDRMSGSVKDGEEVALTLDASLQYSVEQELAEAVRTTRSRSGTAIIMNAVTGEILTMANVPTFNPNVRGSPRDHYRNRAVTDGYEPGSTVKPLLVATALGAGWKLSDTIWAEQGSFVVQGKRIGEAETHEKFGMISLARMLQVSSNVAAAKLSMKLDQERWIGALRAFGLGSKTGIGFPGEISGKLPQGRRLTPLTLATLGFGHGLLATPIQVVRAYASLINGGWLVQPVLTKAALEQALPPKRVLPRSIAEKVLGALQGVTEPGGTGTKAKLDGYPVAGKTGTSQTVDPTTKKYSTTHFVASFVGLPLQVEPKVVIFTLLDGPQGLYYASDTAAPLFQKVLRAYVLRFSIPPSQVLAQARPVRPAGPDLPGDQISWSKAQGMRVRYEQATREIQGLGKQGDGKQVWEMPSLLGLSPREVLGLLRGHEFNLSFRGYGLVKEQLPGPGKIIVDGDLIQVTFKEP